MQTDKDNSFKVTHYPPEVMAEINRDAEEAKKGINVSPGLKGLAAIDYLTKIEKHVSIDYSGNR